MGSDTRECEISQTYEHPVNMTTVEKSLDLQTMSDDVQLNETYVCVKPQQKKKRANWMCRAEWAQSRNYSKFSGEMYEIDIDAISQEQKLQFEVYGDKTNPEVLKRMNEASKEYKIKREKEIKSKPHALKMSPTKWLIYLKNQWTPTNRKKGIHG